MDEYLTLLIVPFPLANLVSDRTLFVFGQVFSEPPFLEVGLRLYFASGNRIQFLRSKRISS